MLCRKLRHQTSRRRFVASARSRVRQCISGPSPDRSIHECTYAHSRIIALGYECLRGPIRNSAIIIRNQMELRGIFPMPSWVYMRVPSGTPDIGPAPVTRRTNNHYRKRLVRNRPTNKQNYASAFVCVRGGAMRKLCHKHVIEYTLSSLHATPLNFHP